MFDNSLISVYVQDAITFSMTKQNKYKISADYVGLMMQVLYIEKSGFYSLIEF